jgi:hypothetical protein
MAISYPVTFPASIGVSSINIRAKTVVGVSSSPFTGQQQVYKHQGQWWEAEVSLPPMKRDEAEQVVSFLIKMNGQYGTFLMGDFLSTAPRGVGTGTPLVNGASQAGDELVTDGWTVSTTGILKAGDWIQLGSASTSTLHKVLDDVTSDGSGNATLNIFPNLRSSPDNNAAITISSPKGRWRLASNETDYAIDNASIYGMTFACVEAL